MEPYIPVRPDNHNAVSRTGETIRKMLPEGLERYPIMVQEEIPSA